MTILNILLITYSVIISILLFAVIKKALNMQRITDNINNVFDFISQRIEYSNKKIKQIDSSGHFESDDEVGFFFKELQNIQHLLNEFNKIYNINEKEEEHK